MANEELKTEMLEKIEEGEFELSDLPQYLNLFCDIANESEDTQEEVEDWNRRFQVKMEGGEDVWIKIVEGKFSCGVGKAEKADTTLTAAAELGAAILTGEKDATSAYMSGDLKIDGEKPDAIKLRTLIEIVRDELED